MLSRSVTVVFLTCSPADAVKSSGRDEWERQEMDEARDLYDDESTGFLQMVGNMIFGSGESSVDNSAIPHDVPFQILVMFTFEIIMSFIVPKRNWFNAIIVVLITLATIVNCNLFYNFGFRNLNE